MNIQRPTHHFLSSVSFSFYDPDTIRKISVKKITSPILFDNLNLPVSGGLYDRALGPFDKNDTCDTCSLNSYQCPGHFGHIELSVPVYNPLTFSTLIKFYKNICTHCHNFRWNQNRILIWKTQLKLLKLGLFYEAKQVDEVVGQFTKDHAKVYLNDKEKEFQSYEDFSSLLINFYKKCKKQNKENPPQGAITKSSIIEQYKKSIIDQFFEKVSSNKCQNCGAYNCSIYTAGGNKIFEIPLSNRHRSEMTAKNRISTPVLDHIEMYEDIDEENDDSQSDEAIVATIKTAKNKRKSEDAQVPTKSKMSDAEVMKDYKYLTPFHIREHFRRVWAVEGEFLSLIFTFSSYDKNNTRTSNPDIFFIETIPVPPTRFRPPSEMNGMIFENPQNGYLTNIVKHSDTIVSLNQQHDESDENKTSATFGQSLFERKINTWILLQDQVNFFYDSSKLSTKGKQAPPGIKQVLEKKEGLFRKHMMGKRVNYAARSVISPDVNIETSEIGLPMVFATRLTYPEPVTRFNVFQLRENIINGPKVHPGATHIQNEDGSLTILENQSVESRIALANTLLTPSRHRGNEGDVVGNKRVFRHVHNGDILLLNRQPTLHKPSIMAHRCRVLNNEKTIRMHYANCNTYNADFDGDEMNIHFPQSELGRAEAYIIANTDNQYLVPTDGSPLRGLIQDHVVTGVILTMRDSLLDKETYFNLLYGTLPETDRKILTIPAALVKPVQLWTGKQVITTLLYNLTFGYPPLNLESKTKIPGRLWGPFGGEESLVKFIDGYLVTGVLDKAQFGSTAYGLVHACYELYDPTIAGQLLTALGKLFTKYLQMIGFTCRMDDLIITNVADLARKDIIKQSANSGLDVAWDYCDLDQKPNANTTDLIAELEKVTRSDDALRGLDSAMKGKMNEITSKIIEKCLPDGQYRLFPKNNMSMMTMSGAKGSIVNFSQISGALGQQELEGRRVPVMVSGRSLPSFSPFDTSARAGGYISGRFLTGIRPQEYFFHCMAGREGLIDTAVKTSRSGYLQRCLIKHMEGLKVQYDQTVRDSEGCILQFYYGEDGLDVIKQKCLQKFGFLASNSAALIKKYKPKDILNKVETNTAWKYIKNLKAEDDPALSALSPAVYLGSTSETFDKDMNSYIQKNPDKLIHLKKKKALDAEGIDSARSLVQILNSNIHGFLKKKQFKALMWLKYMNSLAEPGEAVGLLAAQSVGEPSTQMTLNTFHFAGFGAKNVTLGIPRLREIIMTASRHIKTPTMIVPFKDHVSKDEATLLTNSLGRLTLQDFILDVKVLEKVFKVEKQASRVRRYRTQLTFMTEADCKAAFGRFHHQSFKDVVQLEFIKKLVDMLNKYFKKYSGSSANEGPIISVSIDDSVKGSTRKSEDDGEIEANSGKTSANKNDDDDDDDDNSDNDDEFDAEGSSYKKGKSKVFSSYDELDEKDVEENDADHIDEDDDGSRLEYSTKGSQKDFGLDSLNCDDDDAIDDDKSKIKKSKSNHLKLVEDEKVIPSLFKINSHLKKSYFDKSGTVFTFDLQYPASTPKILLVTFIERLLPKIIVREVPSIKRCFISEETLTDFAGENGRTAHVLSAEGVNFLGFSDHSEKLDLNRVYSNDIFAVLNTYGVEAARAVIMKEIAAVFGVYGISVDLRHLSLIADYMTFEGSYRAMNRIGIHSNVSPFSKMSFETTFSFLKGAALFNDFDTLDSPSAALVMGQVTSVGTGSVEIIHPVVV